MRLVRIIGEMCDEYYINPEHVVLVKSCSTEYPLKKGGGRVKYTHIALIAETVLVAMPIKRVVSALTTTGNSAGDS